MGLVDAVALAGAVPHDVGAHQLHRRCAVYVGWIGRLAVVAVGVAGDAGSVGVGLDVELGRVGEVQRQADDRNPRRAIVSDVVLFDDGVVRTHDADADAVGELGDKGVWVGKVLEVVAVGLVVADRAVAALFAGVLGQHERHDEAVRAKGQDAAIAEEIEKRL